MLFLMLLLTKLFSLLFKKFSISFFLFSKSANIKFLFVPFLPFLSFLPVLSFLYLFLLPFVSLFSFFKQILNCLFKLLISSNDSVNFLSTKSYVFSSFSIDDLSCQRLRKKTKKNKKKQKKTNIHNCKEQELKADQQSSISTTNIRDSQYHLQFYQFYFSPSLLSFLRN